jgi:hypothetical protein
MGGSEQEFLLANYLQESLGDTETWREAWFRLFTSFKSQGSSVYYAQARGKRAIAFMMNFLTWATLQTARALLFKA